MSVGERFRWAGRCLRQRRDQDGDYHLRGGWRRAWYGAKGALLSLVLPPRSESWSRCPQPCIDGIARSPIQHWEHWEYGSAADWTELSVGRGVLRGWHWHLDDVGHP